MIHLPSHLKTVSEFRPQMNRGQNNQTLNIHNLFFYLVNLKKIALVPCMSELYPGKNIIDILGPFSNLGR